MCIIAAKPAGVKLPDAETIETMWHANPHGAGFMYPVTQTNKHKGKKTTTKVVQIEKGFMKLSDFQARLDQLSRELDLTATPMVLHFRITTHGGTCPENTHPFPVTDSVGMLKKLRCTSTLGVAHNGVINSVFPRKGISDTMEYIATQLAPLHKALPRWWENKYALQLVENAIDSKLAILTPEGVITTIGKFTEDHGVLYSNTTYLPSLWDPRFASSCYGGWDRYCFADYDDEPDMAPSTKYLFYLDDAPGSYAMDEDGSLVEDDDLAMDRGGKVYWFDSELGYWVPTNMTACSPAGLPLRYDEDQALPEQVLTSRQAAAWYDYLDENEDEGDTAKKPF